MLTALSVLLLNACNPDVDPDLGNETSDRCLGAQLQATWDVEVDLDEDALVEDLESSLTMRCWTGLAVVGCTPEVGQCDWEIADAEARSEDFLSALAAFDSVFLDYPYDVVDGCACEVSVAQ